MMHAIVEETYQLVMIVFQSRSDSFAPLSSTFQSKKKQKTDKLNNASKSK